jgi:hypothetical protein
MGAVIRGKRVAPGHDAEAVVLDLVNPVGAGWWLIGRTRQAG